MKVKIGKYKNYFGPFQLAKALCFWAKEVPDEYGIKRTPAWVHDFGEWLAYGEVLPDHEVGETKPLFPKNRKETLLAKAICGTLNFIDRLRGERVVKIQIDPWDAWNADYTLGLIILPVLKQLKANQAGATLVDNEDVPEELRRVDGDEEDEHYFHRWDWVLNEMIWAFERLVDPDWENEFYSGEHDTYTVKREDGMYEWVKGEKDTFKVDYEGLEKANDRIDNALRLFGKYYRGLWS